MKNEEFLQIYKKFEKLKNVDIHKILEIFYSLFKNTENLKHCPLTF